MSLTNTEMSAEIRSKSKWQCDNGSLIETSWLLYPRIQFSKYNIFFLEKVESSLVALERANQGSRIKLFCSLHLPVSKLINWDWYYWDWNIEIDIYVELKLKFGCWQFTYLPNIREHFDSRTLTNISSPERWSVINIIIFATVIKIKPHSPIISIKPRPTRSMTPRITESCCMAITCAPTIWFVKLWRLLN